MKVTYLGTTVLLFDDGTDRLLFDAHVTRPPIPRMLFGKAETDGKTVERLFTDSISAVFVSHSHFDHVMDLPAIALRTGAEVHGSDSTLNVARGGGVPEARLHAFRVHEPVRVGAFTVTVIPSLHSKPNRFNNDLGQPIEAPLSQPARLRDYKEGGSFDFIVTHGETTYVIRPSCNFIEGQLNGISADVLFLGTAGLCKFGPEERKRFFAETVDRVCPRLVIPVHWDNFFVPLDRPARGMPRPVEDTALSLKLAAEYCEHNDIEFRLMLPCTSIVL